MLAPGRDPRGGGQGLEGIRIPTLPEIQVVSVVTAAGGRATGGRARQAAGPQVAEPQVAEPQVDAGVKTPAGEKQRFAGQRLLEFAQTPEGEEVIEGTIGGLLFGMPLFVQDNDPAAAALGLGGAVLGGIGVGMAGRRIGAHLGKAVHPAALADQDGLGATIGRIAGQETIGEAMEQNAKMARSQIANYLMERQATRLRTNENAVDVDAIMQMRKVEGMADVIANLPKEQLEAIVSFVNQGVGFMSKQIPQRVRDLEQKMVNGSIDDMSEVGFLLGKAFEDSEVEIPEVFKGLAKGLETGDARPVTGVEVGRAIGRFAGDEIGVLGGGGLGLLLAQQLGIQTPKDREIERLKQQLESPR